MKRLKSLAGVSAVTLLLSACSVTPAPFTSEQNQARLSEDLANLYTNQEKIERPITMYEAMARALKYNMDNRLKMMEAAMSAQNLDAANLDLLPKLTAEAGYKNRNKVDASNSRTLGASTDGTTYSYSDDKETTTAGLGLTWNVLDFGLSYVRAQQLADRHLISQERRRKVIHNIIQDVRKSYWDALSAQRLLTRIDPLYENVKEALKKSRIIEAEKLKSPLETLTYRRDLLEVLRQLKVLRRELVSSKVKLAALMNLKPGTQYTLAPTKDGFKIPQIEIGLEKLEEMALLHRPELLEESYQTRISKKDVTRAMINMIPGVQLSYKLNYDSNHFNYSNHWADWGASVSYNLISAFAQGPAAIESAKKKLKVDETRRMALYMAVLSQVHISWTDFHQYRDEFNTVSELLEVTQGIQKQVANDARTERGNELDVIETDLNSVLAELRRDVAYADTLNAAGNIFLSIGADPLPKTVSGHDIDTLAKAIETNMQSWYGGQIEVNNSTENSQTDKPVMIMAKETEETEKNEQPTLKEEPGFFEKLFN